MLSELTAMTVHLNSFPLSSAKTCCWTATVSVWRCSSHVDVQVNSNDRGKEMLGVECKEELY